MEIAPHKDGAKREFKQKKNKTKRTVILSKASYDALLQYCQD